MNGYRSLLHRFSAASLFLLLPGSAYAQDPGAPAGPKLGLVSGCDFATGDIDHTCLNIIIGNAIEIVFSFAGIICLFNIIIAGYQIAVGGATGSGDTAGKDRLRWALIGFFVTAATYGIINAALQAIQD